MDGRYYEDLRGLSDGTEIVDLCAGREAEMKEKGRTRRDYNARRLRERGGPGATGPSRTKHRRQSDSAEKSTDLREEGTFPKASRTRVTG